MHSNYFDVHQTHTHIRAQAMIEIKMKANDWVCLVWLCCEYAIEENKKQHMLAPYHNTTLPAYKLKYELCARWKWFVFGFYVLREREFVCSIHPLASARKIIRIYGWTKISMQCCCHCSPPPPPPPRLHLRFLFFAIFTWFPSIPLLFFLLCFQKFYCTDNFIFSAHKLYSHNKSLVAFASTSYKQCNQAEMCKVYQHIW